MPAGPHFPGGPEDEGGPPSSRAMQESRWPPSVRCVSLRTNGERCKRWATRGALTCPFHALNKKDQAVTHPRRKEMLRATRLVEKYGGRNALAEANRDKLLVAEQGVVAVLEQIAADPTASNRDRASASATLLSAASRVREGADMHVTVNNISTTTPSTGVSQLALAFVLLENELDSSAAPTVIAALAAADPALDTANPKAVETAAREYLAQPGRADALRALTSPAPSAAIVGEVVREDETETPE